MGYATQQDMIDRFSETEMVDLTDRANTNAVDTVVLGRALADADALIDGYLAGRYTLALATVPASLTHAACDIARFYLYDDHATEAVKKRYDDAIDYLKQVAKGDITLGPDPADTESAGSPQVSTPAREFTKDTLRDF